MKEVFNEIQSVVRERTDMTRDMSESELEKIIDEVILEMSAKHRMTLLEKEQYAREIFNSIRKLDILQELIEDDSITEIMINGPGNIFYEKDGRIFPWEKKFENENKLYDIAQQIAAKSNRIVNESIPVLDTRLSNGSRVNIVLPPVALDGPVITIRKFYKSPITIPRLIQLNSITEEAAEFLEKAVKARYNIFISGGTGSGKTTFLNALSNYIPADERVITIEDSAELQIQSVKNLVRLETRNANVEGENAITIRDLIKSSLRMRPDRIVVGEVRGAEAVDMITAMLTGHDGSLSTGHSNSPRDMLTRIETMVMMGMDIPLAAIKNQIASAIDIIVHLGRLRDKSRKVLFIEEVEGIVDGEIKLNPLFTFETLGEKEGKIVGKLMKQKKLIHDEKMKGAGLWED
ncbi:MAG: CpaF family protein [Thermoflexaceae bacterium]|nr:CpaF family protein [Thermoflexaceae bacterium]